MQMSGALCESERQMNMHKKAQAARLRLRMTERISRALRSLQWRRLSSARRATSAALTL